MSAAAEPDADSTHHRQARGLTYFTWTPADFGLCESPLYSLIVEGPQESAALIRRVLSGEPRALALRAAKLALKTKYPREHYWGAFVLVGSTG